MNFSEKHKLRKLIIFPVLTDTGNITIPAHSVPMYLIFYNIGKRDMLALPKLLNRSNFQICTLAFLVPSFLLALLQAHHEHILSQNLRLHNQYYKLNDALDRNDIHAAVCISDNITHFDTDKVEGFYTSGIINALAGNKQKSRSSFERAVSIFSLNSIDFDTKALAYLELKKPDEAMISAHIAILLGYSPAHGTKAKIYLQEGSYQKAVAEANERGVPNSRLLKSEAYLKLGKTKLALSELNLIVQSMKNQSANCQRGLFRFDLAKALSLRAEALKQLKDFDLAKLDESECKKFNLAAFENEEEPRYSTDKFESRVKEVNQLIEEYDSLDKISDSEKIEKILKKLTEYEKDKVLFPLGSGGYGKLLAAFYNSHGNHNAAEEALNVIFQANKNSIYCPPSVTIHAALDLGLFQFYLQKYDAAKTTFEEVARFNGLKSSESRDLIKFDLAMLLYSTLKYDAADKLISDIPILAKLKNIDSDWSSDSKELTKALDQMNPKDLNFPIGALTFRQSSAAIHAKLKRKRQNDKVKISPETTSNMFTLAKLLKSLQQPIEAEFLYKEAIAIKEEMEQKTLSQTQR